MKKTLLILLSILTTALYSTDLKWVDEQVQAIIPPRKGVHISAVESPFVFLEKNRPKTKESDTKLLPPNKNIEHNSTSKQPFRLQNSSVEKAVFTLDTIINTSAMINGNWYKIDDKISGYKIIEISKTSVTLKNGNKKLILSTVSKKLNIKHKK